MGSLLLRQIKILWYRNYLMKVRQKSPTLQMILWPIYFVGLLVLLKQVAYKPTSFPAMSNLESVNVDTYLPANNKFIVAPISIGIRRFVNKLEGLLPNASFEMHASLSEMDTVYKAESAKGSVPIGIFFPDTADLNKYALRFKYESVPSSSLWDYSMTNCRGDNFSSSVYCPGNLYLTTGFCSLQAIVDASIIQTYNPNYTIPNVVAQRMPKPGGVSNAEVFTILSALYLVMSMSPFTAILLVNVVAEKERKIKDAMKTMGLYNLALWVAWASTYGLVIIVVTLVMSLLTVFGQLFPNSNFFLIFLLFLLYGLSLEMFGFMIATFFSKARTAGSAGGLLNVLMGLLYLVVALVPGIPTVAVWFLCLFSPTGFAIAVSNIALLEVSGSGVQFSNLWTGSNPIGIAYVMLPVDIVLYFLLTLYFDVVVPGEYGQRQPFYFFLMPSYWCPPPPVKDPVTELNGLNNPQTSDDVEAVSDDLKRKESIRFQNITKVYQSGSCWSSDSTSTTAVKDFSLDIYEGQITALLGHNGAGKTTLFNILTGFIDATHGEATVFNYRVSDPQHMQKIREMTGFCPQHNILYDFFSVREHLKVYGGIKGMDDDVICAETDRILKLVGLEDKVATLAKDLSGGQKRKLSVGIAIMGDPKVLILDEPTAGMDPYSRHVLWDALRTRKDGRITLLTTHFMDEADILADRKAILSKGRLRCAGSSLFLKNRFGVGYHLGIVTKHSGNHETITNCVTSHVTGAELQRSTGYELGYTLPITQVGKFADLFGNLERDSASMNIQSFGVCMTTLEEVFLKIGEEDEGDDGDGDNVANGLLSNDEIVKNLKSALSFGKDNVSYDSTDERKNMINHTVVTTKPNYGSTTKFDPAIGKACQPSTVSIFFQLVNIARIGLMRSPGGIIFAVIFPFALTIGGAAVLNISPPTDNIVNPPLIPLTGTSNIVYSPFLYKNSTGGSLTDFVDNSPLTNMQLSDLTDLLLQTTRSYMASDINTFQKNSLAYKALFNTSAVQSLPTIMNVMSQSVLKFINSSAPEIITYNKRWPALTSQPSFNGGAFGGVLMSAFALVMVTGLTILVPVQEKELKIRSQLRVSGVTFGLYWSAAVFFNYVIYIFVCIGFFIGLGAFGVSAFITPGAIGASILLLIGWGVSCIVSSCCGSFLWDKFETAASVWFNVLQLLTFVPYIIVSLVDQLGSNEIAMYLNIVFTILIPYYTGFGGIYYISKLYNDKVLLGQAANIPTAIYFDWSYPMIPFSILMAYLQIALMIVLLQVLDVRANGGKVSDVFCHLSKSSNSISNQTAYEESFVEEEEDDDVMKERKKVNQVLEGNESGQPRPVVLIQNLRKEFSKRTEKKFWQRKTKDETVKVAVKNMSMSVYPGEVLGLLGPNGAGKTTAISVLTADLGPTCGKVLVSDHDIQSNVSDAFKDMGYCRQSNPLWPDITLKEHLQVYAVTRGLDSKSIPTVIDNYVDALEIREHLNKRAKALSGGTQRKLCFAIAMLGNPQVVLLDEPSTGMDPKTKRFMWDTISTAFEGSSRGAILTTHYMDEADALCSRVAIMVLGKLKCIGSTQHLKNKFGQGYILEIKTDRMQEEGDDSLHQFVTSIFGDVGQPEQFSHRYVYKISQENVVSLSKVFSSLEEAKEQLGIEEYSFSQSTLEQVFLQFAREQEERELESEVVIV